MVFVHTACFADPRPLESRPQVTQVQYRISVNYFSVVTDLEENEEGTTSKSKPHSDFIVETAFPYCAGPEGGPCCMRVVVDKRTRCLSLSSAPACAAAHAGACSTLPTSQSLPVHPTLLLITALSLQWPVDDKTIRHVRSCGLNTAAPAAIPCCHLRETCMRQQWS